MITHYINLLGNRDYAQLLRRSRLKEEQLRDVLALITGLNPVPATPWIRPSQTTSSQM